MRDWATRFIELRICHDAYVRTPGFTRSFRINITLFSHALNMTPQPLQPFAFLKKITHQNYLQT